MTYGEHVTTDTLADHAEGLLGESEAGRVSAHLDTCADCRDTALVLASVSDILASDDPGPMPAQYVARINATLADLAIAEPVTPGKSSSRTASVAAASTGGGAQVIDLASRRKIMMTGLRRVSTVAASVVLLIGGVALGIESVQNRGTDGAGPDAVGPPKAVTTPDALITQAVFDIPKDAVKSSNGTFVGSDGTVYVPAKGNSKTASKVLLPNGGEYIKGSQGNPITVKPAPAVIVAPPATGNKGGGQQTAIKPGANPKPAPASSAAPAATAAPPAPAATPAPASSAAAPASTPAAVGPRDKSPRIAANAAPDQGDPYVTESGQSYSEDNFASKVMDLVADAQQHPQTSQNQASSGGGSSVSTSSTGSDPADPAEPNTAGSNSTSSQVSPSQNVATDYSAPEALAPDAHGPASFGTQARVLRCARHTGHQQVIAGDAGTWDNRPATIVVVQSDQPSQVIGYVFYGDCNGQVSAAQAPWTQRVDKPGTAPAAQSTNPPKRVGDVSGSQTHIKSSVPATADPLDEPTAQATETSAFIPSK